MIGTGPSLVSSWRVKSPAARVLRTDLGLRRLWSGSVAGRHICIWRCTPLPVGNWRSDMWKGDESCPLGGRHAGTPCDRGRSRPQGPRHLGPVRSRCRGRSAATAWPHTLRDLLGGRGRGKAWVAIDLGEHTPIKDVVATLLTEAIPPTKWAELRSVFDSDPTPQPGLRHLAGRRGHAGSPRVDVAARPGHLRAALRAAR